MTTITIKIDERTGMGKAILELIRTSARENKGIEVIDPQKKADNYNDAFVEKILHSHKNDKRIRINPEKLWESI